MDVLVREARENELDEAGAVTAAAYTGVVSPEYLQVLRDTRTRWEAEATTVLVALDDGTDGVLGAVVYAAPGSPYRNLGQDSESEVRMLGVLEAARGRGVGEALVRGCIALAKAQGCPRLVLSTEPEMTAAQRLYARLGFVRTPERDWSFSPELSLLTYALDLTHTLYCGQCGRALAEVSHAACAARLRLEPPRYCGRCARRMVVQVLPTGWTARCSVHGVVDATNVSAD